MSATKKKNYNSELIKAYAVKPIAFNPNLAKITNSAVAGLLLSQLLYWMGKGKKPDCVYKTIKQMKEETCLTISEQNRGIKLWKELDVLNVKNEGVPPTRNFRINFKKLEELIKKQQAIENPLAEEFLSDSGYENQEIKF